MSPSSSKSLLRREALLARAVLPPSLALEAKLAADKLAAVRVRDLNQPPHFPGLSHSGKYKLLRGGGLDTFHIGRVQYVTLESIHRLKATLIAKENPDAKSGGRPRKPVTQAEATA